MTFYVDDLAVENIIKLHEIAERILPVQIGFMYFSPNEARDALNYIKSIPTKEKRREILSHPLNQVFSLCVKAPPNRKELRAMKRQEKLRKKAINESQLHTDHKSEDAGFDEILAYSGVENDLNCGEWEPGSSQNHPG